MYDGKQVVKVKNKYKTKDLYNIGIEMKERKGTGNYDKDRTKFNVDYVSLTEKNLYQEIKKIVKDRDIEYLKKSKTNVLNGVVFTSGPEFFESLGMKMIDSGRTYKSGEKEGQIVKIPFIKSEEDIPQLVKYYFDCCMEFLEDYVGKENIILAQVHYDEDTPHLQAYFLPIVNEVKRKCYEKDSKGNVIKEEYKNKLGQVSYVPKLKRDNNGKIIYEKVKGTFINNDQFWKDRGGINSFAKMQDSFNKFINEKGFKLDRGNVGANNKSKTKLEFQIEENKAELKALKEEKENVLSVIKDSKEKLIEANNDINKEVLNPKKKLGVYNNNDIQNIISYSKNLEQINTYQKAEINNQNVTIQKLKKENSIFKNNEELLKRNKIIQEQKKTIANQDSQINDLNDLVNLLNHNIIDLKNKLENQIEKLKKVIVNIGMALCKVLKIKTPKHLEEYNNLANAINNDYYNYNHSTKNKDDDFEIGI